MIFNFNQKTAVIIFLIFLALVLLIFQGWVSFGRLAMGILVGVIIGNIFRMLE
jgi:multisubunit Na+/H+ antiporter MnhE subunit